MTEISRASKDSVLKNQDSRVASKITSVGKATSNKGLQLFWL